MPACPNCAADLNTIRHREGLVFNCPGCGGRAVTLPQIRRVAGDAFAVRLLRQINENPNFGGRPCPFCTRLMRLFRAPDPPVELDACKGCGVVWFDPREFEAVPDTPVESAEAARLRGVETEASWRAWRWRDRENIELPPDEEWKAVPALFGFPVESDVDPLSRRPWITWLLSLTIALVSIRAFFDLEAAVATFGFIPAQAWREGGLTLLTSFFLHGDVLHLVGNLYFFLVFGDNVEDYLGRWRYALLLVAATVAGGLVHLAAVASSVIPAVGASGGISGVIVFYALQFPRARLGFMFGRYTDLRWVHIPAWTALVLWLLLQSVMVVLEMGGHTNVAATSHFGGAAIGFLFWLLWRKR